MPKALSTILHIIATGIEIWILLGILSVCATVFVVFRDKYMEIEEKIRYKKGLPPKAENKELTKEAEQLYKRAKEGDAQSQYRLYQIYWNEKDEDKRWFAFRHCRSAADAGHADAIASMCKILRGMINLKDGMENDADTWQQLTGYLTSLAELEIPEYQRELAEVYATFYKDSRRAYHWYSKAAEQGDGQSLFEIGKMYYKGIYIQRDFEKATTYLKAAKESGIKEANTVLEEIEMDRQALLI